MSGADRTRTCNGRMARRRLSGALHYQLCDRSEGQNDRLLEYGRWESNPRSPAPKAGTLTATLRPFSTANGRGGLGRSVAALAFIRGIGGAGASGCRLEIGYSSCERPDVTLRGLSAMPCGCRRGIDASFASPLASLNNSILRRNGKRASSPPTEPRNE